MGERARRSIRVAVEPEQPENLGRPAARCAARRADAERRDLDVLPDGQRPEGVRVLERAREAVTAPPVGAPAT